MLTNGHENPVQARLALPACAACPERSRGKPSECVSLAPLVPPALLALSEPEGSGVEGSGCEGNPVNPAQGSQADGSLAPPRHEPLLTSHPLLPIANRNIAELATVLSHCKQRTTTLSNRHKIRLEKWAENLFAPLVSRAS